MFQECCLFLSGWADYDIMLLSIRYPVIFEHKESSEELSISPKGFVTWSDDNLFKDVSFGEYDWFVLKETEVATICISNI